MDPSPAKAVAEFFASDWLYVAGVALATFVYLLVDFFIVIRGFASIPRARSFWVFWFCVAILNLLAFEALNSVPGMAKAFGAAKGLALVVISTLGTITILQSFALKIGDLMSFGGRDAQRVKNDLEQIGRDALALGVPETRLLAREIAQADVREALNLVRRADWYAKPAAESAKSGRMLENGDSTHK